ncbi:2-oxoglutarate dehydrogenase [Paraburkholderia phosphatilytica]|uniref:2-oxoglutarate dehydrogenase n=1 Tax=Paraburkholderia phosphatilytica TaxID=2282883 RepID=UPI000E46FEDC|nr:2-oxoglutarate dehydrogenase [Paraburkholderia phosphatilytica]
MSPIDMLRRIVLPLFVLSAIGSIGAAHAATTQSVAPVTLPKGGHGVDGPFFPSNRPAPETPSTGTQLQQQAQQRIEARMGGNSVLSNGATITKAQAQTNGLGFIAKHFDQIDSAHTGRVSMSDVRQYLQQQQRQ